MLWALLRRDSIPQVTPSWTGFYVEVHSNSLILKTSVGYLDSINKPATETSTIYEVMNRALSIVDSLHLTSIVCVFDQAIYARAAEIKWKEPQKFKRCVPMMGMFHTTMMYMSILSNRFKYAGLRDLLIQSSVIAEGSIDRALCGKMYKRGIRMYKLAYEALTRLLLQCVDEKVDDSIVADVNAIMSMLKEKITHEKVLESANFQKYYSSFLDVKLAFSEECNPNGLQRFWISFVAMVDILLNTIYAIRLGEWELLLECIRDMLPYVFAYDKINYARYEGVVFLQTGTSVTLHWFQFHLQSKFSLYISKV